VAGPVAGPVIGDLARELGFARAAIVPIEPPRRHELYASWLAAGRAGEMTYLASPEHTAPRADLRALLGTAASLIVVALACDRRQQPQSHCDRSQGWPDLPCRPDRPDRRSELFYLPLGLFTFSMRRQA
jgi:epoxyqueuosine reductase QueG